MKKEKWTIEKTQAFSEAEGHYTRIHNNINSNCIDVWAHSSNRKETICLAKIIADALNNQK